MGNYDDIGLPVQGQPVSSGAFGIKVRNYLINADARLSAVEGNQQLVLKRGRRSTSTGNVTTTEVGFLRVDNVPVLAGKIYQINATNLNIDSSVDNDVGRVAMRVKYAATTGSAAGIADTMISYLRNTIDNNTQSNVNGFQGFYIATADGYISVLLSLIRQAGTGNLIFFGGSSDICDLVIQFGGTDPGDTGVVL